MPERKYPRLNSYDVFDRRISFWRVYYLESRDRLYSSYLNREIDKSEFRERFKREVWPLARRGKRERKRLAELLLSGMHIGSCADWD